jgi:glycosyltransferase involved in cell wall biosynthesis
VPDESAGRHTIPLSLIIPVHGRQRKLERALASIARQNVLPSEVVIVDDGSSPPASVSEALRAKLSVTLIRHAENKGAAAARNTGMRAAANEWVTFLDSDDFLLDDTLAARWAAAVGGAARPQDKKTIHGCGWVDIDETERPLLLRQPRAASSPYEFASGCWFSPGSCVIMNAKAALAVAPQDESLARFEDLDWFLALSLAGFSLVTTDVTGVAIERARRQDPLRIAGAIAAIREKWRRRSGDARLLRRLDAYLDLELAAARYFAGSRLGAFAALARSFARVPRTTLQLSPGWATEKISVMPSAKKQRL